MKHLAKNLANIPDQTNIPDQKIENQDVKNNGAFLGRNTTLGESQFKLVSDPEILKKVDFEGGLHNKASVDELLDFLNLASGDPSTAERASESLKNSSRNLVGQSLIKAIQESSDPEHLSYLVNTAFVLTTKTEAGLSTGYLLNGVVAALEKANSSLSATTSEARAWQNLQAQIYSGFQSLASSPEVALLATHTLDGTRKNVSDTEKVLAARVLVASGDPLSYAPVATLISKGDSLANELVTSIGSPAPTELIKKTIEFISSSPQSEAVTNWLATCRDPNLLLATRIAMRNEEQFSPRKAVLAQILLAGKANDDIAEVIAEFYKVSSKESPYTQEQNQIQSQITSTLDKGINKEQTAHGRTQSVQNLLEMYQHLTTKHPDNIQAQHVVSRYLADQLFEMARKESSFPNNFTEQQKLSREIVLTIRESPQYLTRLNIEAKSGAINRVLEVIELSYDDYAVEDLKYTASIERRVQELNALNTLINRNLAKKDEAPDTKIIKILDRTKNISYISKEDQTTINNSSLNSNLDNLLSNLIEGFKQKRAELRDRSKPVTEVESNIVSVFRLCESLHPTSKTLKQLTGFLSDQTNHIADAAQSSLEKITSKGRGKNHAQLLDGIWQKAFGDWAPFTGQGRDRAAKILSKSIASFTNEKLSQFSEDLIDSIKSGLKYKPKNGGARWTGEAEALILDAFDSIGFYPEKLHSHASTIKKHLKKQNLDTSRVDDYISNSQATNPGFLRRIFGI